MIILEWSNLAAEIDSLAKLQEYLKIHQIPVEGATVKFRVKVPLKALDGVIEEIVDSGGKVL